MYGRKSQDQFFAGIWGKKNSDLFFVRPGHVEMQVSHWICFSWAGRYYTVDTENRVQRVQPKKMPY